MSQYIKIGAATKAVGVTKSTLEDWAKMFSWDIERNDQGHRLYSQAQIDQALKYKNEQMTRRATPRYDEPVSPRYRSPQPVAYVEY